MRRTIALLSTTVLTTFIVLLSLAPSGGGGGGGGNGSGTNTVTIVGTNVATMWVTNLLSPTNVFSGTLIDFAKPRSRIVLTGNLTFTGFANITAGAVNEASIACDAGGADRTIVFPAGVHPGRGATLVVTNGTEGTFFFHLEPGVRTNGFQIDSI